MDPHGKDIDGAAVGVKARIYDTLEVPGQPKRPPKADAIEQIQAGFRSSLDGPVADEAIYAAKGQIFRVDFGDPPEVDPNARDVLEAAPPNPLS
jgi:hypothetical protein